MKKRIILGLIVLAISLFMMGSVTAVDIERPIADDTITWSKFNCFANWLCVNDFVLDTSDYVATAEEELELYIFSTNFSGSNGRTRDIAYINLQYYVRPKKPSPAIGMCFYPALRIGAQDYLSGLICPSDGWNVYTVTYPLNPWTGNPWTYNQLDLLKAGMESKREGLGSIAVSNVFMHVAYS